MIFLPRRPVLITFPTKFLRNVVWNWLHIVCSLVPRALFNQSLTSGELPDDWTTANVSPVFKKGSKSDPSNYRPISLTSVVCKCLEHVIHRHIMFHIERHQILTDCQHGFRKNRGCDTQLLITVDDIARSVEKSRSTLYYLIFQRRLIAFLIKDSSLNSSTMVLLAL